MTTINQLSAVTTVALSDQLPIYSQSNGDARKTSITTLMETVRNNLGDASGDSLTVTDYIKTTGVLVSNLPSASVSGAGARAFVTDATATTFASTVAGGGANNVPVYSDGTDWKIG